MQSVEYYNVLSSDWIILEIQLEFDVIAMLVKIKDLVQKKEYYVNQH